MTYISLILHYCGNIDQVDKNSQKFFVWSSKPRKNNGIFDRIYLNQRKRDPRYAHGEFYKLISLITNIYQKRLISQNCICAHNKQSDLQCLDRELYFPGTKWNHYYKTCSILFLGDALYNILKFWVPTRPLFQALRAAGLPHSVEVWRVHFLNCAETQTDGMQLYVFRLISQNCICAQNN